MLRRSRPAARVSAQPLAPTRQALLLLLKRAGRRSARELAARLGVTPTAVRQHLLALGQSGLVRECARPPGGRGRPARLWDLREGAEAHLPDGHAALCLTLAGALRASLAPLALRRALGVALREQVRAYRERLRPHTGLGPRLRALAAEREREGFLVQVVRNGAGGYLLVQNHCPVGRAACALPELCTAEQRTLRQALGHVTVTLVEHRLGGASRCTWRIHPRPTRSPRARRAV